MGSPAGFGNYGPAFGHWPIKGASTTFTAAANDSELIAAVSGVRHVVDKIVFSHSTDASCRVDGGTGASANEGPTLRVSDEQQTIQSNVRIVGDKSGAIVGTVSAACVVFLYYHDQDNEE